MPISREDFEQNNFIMATKADQILSFLISNKDKAFRKSEVAELLSLESSCVSTYLHNLKKMGLVEYKKPYWCLKKQVEK